MSSSKYKNLKSLIPMTQRLQEGNDDWQDIFDEYAKIRETIGVEKYYWSQSLKSDPVSTVLWPFARALAIHPGVDLKRLWPYHNHIAILCTSHVPLMDGLSLNPMIPIWMDSDHIIHRLAFYTSAIVAMERNSKGYTEPDYMGVDTMSSKLLTSISLDMMDHFVFTLEKTIKSIDFEDIVRVASRADEVAIERSLGEKDRTHHLYRQLFAGS